MKTAILAVPALFLMAAPIGNADATGSGGPNVLCLMDTLGVETHTFAVTGGWDFTLTSPNDDGDWDISFDVGDYTNGFGDEAGQVPYGATSATVCLYGESPGPTGIIGITAPLWVSLGSSYEYTETEPETCEGTCALFN